MSKIIATDNFKSQNWHVTLENLAPTFANLFIGFTDDAPVVEFKGLRFAYKLKQNSNIEQQGDFPPTGVKYIRSDQDYLVSEFLNLRPETEYELYLWAENGGKSFETTVAFTTPRPAQPYPSWTWDGEQWNPPVPYPDDGKQYTWDEATTSWVEASAPENQ